jgi:hypothetical protein
MTTEITNQELVYTIAGADEVLVERDQLYLTDHGPLPFDLYRPKHPAPRSPAVVFISGYADPGNIARFGKPFKAWAFYRGWARLVAASGITAVTYTNREPSDVFALLRHLRANAEPLGLHATKLGVWASSGHVPLALSVIAREPLASAALLYGYLLDLDGATAVAQAAAMFQFASPKVTLEDLPAELPMMIVRAGGDQMPGLDATLRRFVAAAAARGMAVTLVEHAQAPHAFDLVDSSPRTREVIEEVLAFLRRTLE